MDAEFEHALPVQKFFVYEFAVKLCRSGGQSRSRRCQYDYRRSTKPTLHQQTSALIESGWSLKIDEIFLA